MTDRLSLGSGKEVMPYLKDGDERTLSFNLALAEGGNMGHIVPGHNYLLELVCVMYVSIIFIAETKILMKFSMKFNQTKRCLPCSKKFLRFNSQADFPQQKKRTTNF